MRWPWQKKVEARGYSDLILQALESAVADSEAGGRSAAVVTVGEYLAREMGAAEIMTPPDAPIRREWLAWMARQCVLEGEALSLIRMRPDGSITLLPVADHDWHNSRDPDEETWRGRVTIYAPGGSVTLNQVERSRLIVLRWSWNQYSPGFGRGPGALAGTAAKLASRSEQRQSDHANTPVRPILSLPPGTEGETLTAIRQSFGKGGGLPVTAETPLVPSQSPGMQHDWTQKNLRPEPTAQLNEMARDAFDRMVASCGVPPSLFHSRADGTSLREAARQGRMRVVEPVRMQLEDELRRRLDDSIRLSLDAYALDMVSRAQVVDKLAKAGVDLATAMSAVGMMEATQ